ncbi:mucin-17-like [Daphnia carinata]|uniref:mucin-17-like n=1 Tax=Daphnia carinata TaxID=120202 RepID=UPI00257F3BAC|nr:mucin-17-like [Daphnia carinata]
MRLFSSIIMCLVGVMLFAPSYTDANAFAARRNGAKTEVESTSSAAVPEEAPAVNPSQTTSRGKIKFHMKTLANVAEVAVRRPRINRVRSTTVRPNIVFRDSLEQDVSLEDLNIKPIKTIMRTSTTPRPIFADSLENDDIAIVLTKPVVNRNPVAATRFNRFRTTTVPTSVTRDSLEQDDDAIVLALKPAEQTSLPVRGRFNRINSASRVSVEKNDVSLEDLIVVAKPVLNGALSASRTRGRIQMKSSLDSISPSTSTEAPTTPVDVTEKIDISLDDLEKTTFDIPTTTMVVTEVETATTDETGTTPMPTIPISLQSDEQDDVLFITDRTTVPPEPTNDAIETTATVVQLTTQSDEQMDFERVEKLAVTQDVTQLDDQLSNAAMTTLVSQQSDERDDWTVSVPTTTMAPAVTRSPLVSKGRGRLQSATPVNQSPKNRVNRIRLNPVKSSISTDDQQIGVVAETQTAPRAPVSRNRFSRIRSTTARTLVLRDSVEQNDVSLEDLVVVVPTTRRPLMGSRFSRFRTTTATPVAVTVGQEAPTPKSEVSMNRNRFSRVRSTTARVPVSLDSIEDDIILLTNDFSKMKAGQVASQQTTLNRAKVMSTSNLAINRGRVNRRRTTTTATPILRHSAEDVSLEDVLKEVGKTGEQLPVQQPAISIVPVDLAVTLSEISRHSDERDDIVDVAVGPMEAIALVVEDTDADVSDEIIRTTTLDPVSSESGEKDGLTLVLVDETDVPAVPVGSLQMVNLPEINDETLLVKESEELPLRQMTKRVRMIRKQKSQM